MAYELKTQKNSSSVSKFIASIDNTQRQQDSNTLLQIMSEITGEKPVMWGDSIIGFGEYEYTYKSGHSGKWFKLGFSPRKQNISIYIMPGYQDFKEYLQKLGPHKTGKCCLYITKLERIDIAVLTAMMNKGLEYFENILQETNKQQPLKKTNRKT